MDDPGEPAPSIRPLPRLQRLLRGRNVLIILAAIAVVTFFWKFPAWQIRHARSAWIDCVNRFFREPTGSPAECRQSGTLWLPKLLPWTRKAARQLAADIDYDVAEDQLKVASRLDLDRTKRDRAAIALLALYHSDPRPDAFFATGARLRDAGAGAVLLAHDGELTEASERAAALAEALRAGDRAAMARIASKPAAAGQLSFDRDRGAVLCMLGDKPQGLAALDADDHAFTTGDHPSQYGDRDARFAIALCDPSRTVEVDEVWHDRLRVLHAVGGGGVEMLGDTAAYNPDTAIAAIDLLAHTKASFAHDYLHYIDRPTGARLAPASPMLSPWSILAGPSELPSTPGWSDDAAAMMIALADASSPPPKPRHGHVVEPPYDRDVSNAAMFDPQAYLRWGALVVALDAAVGWTRRGDATRAQASMTVAMTCAHHPDVARMEPYASVLVVPVLHLLGRNPEALAEVDGLLARLPADAADVRATLIIERVLLLAHDRKFAEAWTALDPAMSANIDPRSRAVVAWLRAALAIRLGRDLDLTFKQTPDEPPMDDPLLALAYWWPSAKADATTQRHNRWKADDAFSIPLFDVLGVLPAVFTVIGQTAGDGDVELWLDVESGRDITDPQALASARAEAARWRGDDAAAVAWDQRLAAMRALATDDRGAYFLSLVHGW